MNICNSYETEKLFQQLITIQQKHPFVWQIARSVGRPFDSLNSPDQLIQLHQTCFSSYLLGYDLIRYGIIEISRCQCSLVILEFTTIVESSLVDCSDIYNLKAGSNSLKCRVYGRLVFLYPLQGR